MSDCPLAIGVDFGGTTVKAGVVYQSNIIDPAPPIATKDFGSPEELIGAMARIINELKAKHPSVSAIGVGMPGFIDFEKGTIQNLTNVPGWHAVPLKKLLAKATGSPVFVENDANCMAFAEWKRGSGRGLQHLVCIGLGTGVGGGLVVNGQLVRGACHAAGEIGQTSIDYRGRPGHYGNLGALEDYVGNKEIAQSACEAYLAAGIEKSPEQCTPAALAAAAIAEDPVALACWDEVARMLATAAMNCCWLLNPQAIILGGGVSRAGEVLFKPFTHYLCSQLSDPFKENLMILPATFGHEAGIIGAAALALESSGFPIGD
jgi:glucokinase